MTAIQRHPSSVPKAALVTGGAKRIGRALALHLARDGWSVAIHYLDSSDEADALVAELRALGVEATALQADLTREAEVTPLVKLATEAIGPLGVLVNNASIFEQDELLSSDRESWDRHIEANLRAPVVLMQQFAQQLPAAHDGVIINMLDQRVWNPTGDFMSYTTSKIGLWSLTQTLALELAPRIRINAIGPGPALPSPRQSAELFARQAASVPLEHGTTPEELAAAMSFILSASSMTGQMIALDGGQHLLWAPPGDHVAKD
jgi:NAD(P)-dependent dehydrogenase (short-subunit alcohol dehydrogenase family)